MSRSGFLMAARWGWPTALLATWLAGAANAAPLSLAEAFERAWARQPEAQALAQRREAGSLLREAASAWTPEPPSVEAALRSDRFHRRQGAQEVELGVAVPLWLPGERALSQALADAQARLVEAQAELARWQLAERLREPWWALRLAREELSAAEARLQASQALAADVARRVQAGDLARADQHQAQAAVAAAQADQALARAQLIREEQGLRALLGLAPFEPIEVQDGAEPEPQDQPLDAHPLLALLAARAEAARRAAELAGTQSQANPELSLTQVRDRAARGQAGESSLVLGLRFPLGRSDRQRAAVVSAAAERTEAELALQRERERVEAGVLAARAQMSAAHSVLVAAGERARLAAETRDFFARSFQLGETDLPTRLRVELEAGQAQQQLVRARLQAQQAIATLRQALGLLPQ